MEYWRSLADLENTEAVLEAHSGTSPYLIVVFAFVTNLYIVCSYGYVVMWLGTMHRLIASSSNLQLSCRFTLDFIDMTGDTNL